MASKTAAAKQNRAKSGNGARTKKKSTKSKSGSAQKGLRRLRLPRISISRERVIDLAGSLLTIAGILTGLAMLPSRQPSLAQPWLDLLASLFGLMAFAVPVGMVVLGVWLVARRFVDAAPPPWYRLFGLTLFLLALFGLLGLFGQWEDGGQEPGYGGLLGKIVGSGLTLAVGPIGAPVASLFMGLLGLLFLLELSLEDVARGLARLRPARKAPEAAPTPPTSPSPRVIQLPLPSVPEMLEQTRSFWQRLLQRRGERKEAAPPVVPPPFRPVLAAKQMPTPQSAPPASPPSEVLWQLPPWRTLLEDSAEADSNPDDIRRKVKIIEETLAQFGVPARVVEVNRGPTVTQYGVEPGYVQKRVRGKERQMKVKVAAITNLQNDLALALAAQRIRLEAPVPGRSYVGIEVPNDRAATVTLRGTMESEEFQTLDSPLRLALGRDVSGQAVVADMAKMPHLLIAGATGSGKSVCINAVICSLLCNNTPDQLKLLMVDPKMVELIGYNGVPHLIVPVVTEIDRVVGLLRWTVNEMERRYKIFSESQVRNIQAYNARALRQGEKPLPYLVLIIDELADLMMAAADQVEAMICRLAQMARATGIHMVLATQRPSVDVVTGLIKANFPARIAFGVTSSVDSRVILDRPGAESLLGRGDMLYMSSDSGALKRAQGCFVSDRELERINRFWIEQAEAQSRPTRAISPSQSDEAVESVQAVMWDELLADGESGEEDELLPRAREIVQKVGSASISMLQRRLRVGYARAARLVDLLEEEGTIGASEGPGKTREVYNGEAEPGSEEDPGFDPAWIDEED